MTNQAEPSTKPPAYCVCTHAIERHHEFTDQCPDCPCTRPREEAKPTRRLFE